jgi:hypothetical protein
MIYTIIKNTVTSLHKVIDITLQVNEGDGTYTLTLDEVWLIKTDGFVLGSNGTRYQVNNISGLTINITKDDPDILTTVQCLQPYFYGGNWLDYSNYLMGEEKQYQENKQIFPSVFLIEGYTEGENPLVDPAEITIFLNDYTYELTNDDRETNEIPYINILKTEFMKKLERNNYVIRIIDPTYKKTYNEEYDTNNKTNRLEITLNITHLLTVSEC